MQRPLATVVVGGMLIGPVMLLVVVSAVQLLILGRDEHGLQAANPAGPREHLALAE